MLTETIAPTGLGEAPSATLASEDDHRALLRLVYRLLSLYVAEGPGIGSPEVSLSVLAGELARSIGLEGGMADLREKVEVRTFDESDESFETEMGHAERISVGGLSVWRALAEPGWRFTEGADGDLCSAPHALYIESGRLHVLMADGTEAEGGPGAVMVIEPGHDAWTVGDEPCVFIDFGESVELTGRN